MLLPLPSLGCVRAQIINGISTQRTRILVAALKPLIQTRSMEQILARRTPLIRHALVCRDDAVANSTLTLTLQGADNVALEDLESVDDVAIGEGDHSLGRHDPGLPLLFADSNTMEPDNRHAFDGVALGDLDGDGGLAFVDFVASCHFASGFGNTHNELLLIHRWRLLVISPVLNLIERIRNDEG